MQTMYSMNPIFKMYKMYSMYLADRGRTLLPENAENFEFGRGRVRRRFLRHEKPIYEPLRRVNEKIRRL